MAELVGNLLVAQSGGPTAVINASVAGVIQEAGKHGMIEEIYGGLNGIIGILNEELIDLNEEKARAIEGLKSTPGVLSSVKSDARPKTMPDVPSPLPTTNSAPVMRLRYVPRAAAASFVASVMGRQYTWGL